MRVSSSRWLEPLSTWETSVSIRADASELLEGNGEFRGFCPLFQFALMRVSSSRANKTRQKQRLLGFQFALMRVSSSRRASANCGTKHKWVSIRADASELLEVKKLPACISIHCFNSR